LGGFASVLETATDTFVKNLALFNQGDYELALAANGTWMTAGDYLMDTNLNGAAFISLNEREMWNEKAVYGEKLSTDGTLLFLPLTDALDVIDGRGWQKQRPNRNYRAEWRRNRRDRSEFIAGAAAVAISCCRQTECLFDDS
jgi:hypothetical protein